MKLVKIINENTSETIYVNDTKDYFQVPREYRKLQLNTLDRSIHIFFNDDDNNLIDINGPFYIRIKEDIKCYNEWEVHPTHIGKDMELFVDSIDINFGITKYMLGFNFIGTNSTHYIDPEHVDFIRLESEKSDSKSEVKKVVKSNEPELEVKKVSKSNNTKPKTKSTTVKKTNISKNIKNMCDIGKPGITLDDEKLKELNESINDSVNKLCVFIERKDKVNKIISALSDSSKNIKISDSDFNLNVKIIPLDLDIQIPSAHLFDNKDINKLILDYHKKEYDSIKEEIGILKGMIFRDLDILLIGKEE